MTLTTVPLLLPPYATRVLSEPGPSEWKPQRYLQPPQPPPPDENRQDMELAVARNMIDGKALKKTRPRRTVDYTGAMGRWILMRKVQTNLKYTPYMRPSPPYIIDLLPPKAYPENPATSLCTKFVHTSTNKIRCPVNVVTWTPEGRRILTGSTSGEFTLWNGLTFNFETILQAHDHAIRTINFTHNGAYIASADQGGVIKYFQPNMNNLTAWQGHREAIRGLSFSPGDDRFATASDDSTVVLWSFERQEKERVLTGHGWDVRCVEWHPTKGLLVSGSKDNQMKFWDPRTGTSLTTLRQHKNTIQALSWSPSGNLIASASRDQTVRVFDIRAMKELCILRGHKKEVCSVAWHPVHPMLVSGGSEGALLHWDLSLPTPLPTATSPTTTSIAPTPIPTHTPTHSPRATLSQAHDSNIWSLAFHPLGHLLVTASNDHTTRFWSRERPGDSGSVFSAGGEKPPLVVDMAGQEDEDEGAVPGFGFGGGAIGGGGGWWTKEEPGVDGGETGFGGAVGTSGGEMGMDAMDDDFIPGFGAAEVPGLGGGGAGAAPRQNGPLPPQEDVYGGDGPPPFGLGMGRGRGGGGDDWGHDGARRRGGGGGGRWGGRDRRGRY